MTDERIDPLGNSAILTDTQIRLAFAPQDPKANLIAMKLDVRKDRTDRMAALMQVGKVHLQVKAGFAPERSIELTGPELMILMDMADRFVTELPAARRAALHAVPDHEDILLWPDGDWCFRSQEEEMTHKSDDYRVVTVGSRRWDELTSE